VSARAAGISPPVFCLMFFLVFLSPLSLEGGFFMRWISAFAGMTEFLQSCTSTVLCETIIDFFPESDKILQEFHFIDCPSEG